VKLHPANADASESLYFIPKVIKHHADLTLEAHLEHDSRTVACIHPSAFGTGESFFGHHAFDEFRHHLSIQWLIDDDLVFLFSSMARMNDLMG